MAVGTVPQEPPLLLKHELSRLAHSQAKGATTSLWTGLYLSRSASALPNPSTPPESVASVNTFKTIHIFLPPKKKKPVNSKMADVVETSQTSLVFYGSTNPPFKKCFQPWKLLFFVYSQYSVNQSHYHHHHHHYHHHQYHHQHHFLSLIGNSIKFRSKALFSTSLKHLSVTHSTWYWRVSWKVA